MAVKLLAGRYELIEKIGDGGMAVVYKARDRLLNRYIAIKILKPEFAKDPSIIESFRRESQSAAALSHPNIVSIFDVGREGNIHFIVMELIEGETLATMIENIGPMDYHQVIDITKQIASGLSYAHKNNIIHRDIKPHNILITPDGVAKIADFGIAKAITESSITTKQTEEMVMGSVHYFSPEQARGGYVDAKSDIYSLGIVMYEMLTGRVPFDAETPVQVALMHINEEMIPPSYFVPTIPPRLESIIMKCTDKVQVNRYRDADEIIRELDRIDVISKVVGEKVLARDGVSVKETPAPPKQPEKPEKKEKSGKKKLTKKQKTIAIVAGIAALLAVLAAVFFMLRDKGEITVPDIKGATYEEAEAELTELGLKIKMGNEVFSDEYEEGEIVSQDPEPKMKVKKGQSVTVNISKGTGTEAVPSVIGCTSSEAREILEAKGFSLGNIREEESSQAEGTIISQDPGSGYEAESGSSVNVVIAKKPEITKVTVPGLLGKSTASAESALSNAGLRLGDISYKYSDEYPEGQIMDQEYASGTQLDEDSEVDVVVSKGAKEEPAPAPTPAPSEEQSE